MTKMPFAIAPLLLLSFSAIAENEVYVGAGGQYYTLLEHDRITGRQLVKEQGWLPSIVYGLDWPTGRYRFHGQIQQSLGVISYDGQTQSGIPHQTETTHYLTQGNVSMGIMATKLTELYLGLNLQEDIRNVANRNNVYGATEIYDEVMLRYGIKQTLFNHRNQQLLAWAEAQAVYHASSRVNQRVAFDDTTIFLRKGSAYAFGLRYQKRLTDKKSWFIDSSYYVHQYKDSSFEPLTSNGNATANIAYQPPISFTHNSIYGGMVWKFD